MWKARPSKRELQTIKILVNRIRTNRMESGVTNLSFLPELAYVPGGEYWIGDDAGRQDERPAHIVQIEGFWSARTPVTNYEYARYLKSTGAQPPPFWHDLRFSHSNQPVVGVSWSEAVDYCSWISSWTGRAFRLPTEAEWEVAARGGLEHAKYAWGTVPPVVQGISLAELPQTAPCEVCHSPANGYGLCDFGFNVHEWCGDWYDAAFYRTSPRLAPTGPPFGTRRCSRGGAWRHQVKVSRCAARSSLRPDFRYNDYGFRVFAD
jgi:formylglycine-generating enzyme required for sulfatase activity